ncbi:MAG: hypothetical protein ACP5I8_13220 [Phycisphaerae bacterium]
MTVRRSIVFLCLLLGTMAGANSVEAGTSTSLRVKAVQSGHGLLVTATARKPSALQGMHIQIFIHLSGQAGGYVGAAGGPYGIMVEDNIVYVHHGDRAGWGWRRLGSARSRMKGSSLTTRIKAALILAGAKATGNIHARLLVRLLNTKWAVTSEARTSCRISPDSRGSKSKIRSEAVGTAAPHADRLLSPRQRLAAAKSYYCYYGGGHVARLSKYDVVILHAPEMSTRNVRRLDALGVVTLGYMAIGESSRLIRGNGSGPGGYASWYFGTQRTGHPDKNGTWNSYYTNCANSAWREHCLHQASWLMHRRGFSGLFLDTVNTYVLYPHSGARAGTIKLVSELRKRFPNAPIVLNQGFKILPEVAPWIDGVMLESFTLSWRTGNNGVTKYIIQRPSALNWSSALVRHRIDPVIRKYPLKLLALDYALPTQTRRIQMAANRAATLGCLDAVAPKPLNQVYTFSVVGHPQAKWLHRVH